MSNLPQIPSPTQKMFIDTWTQKKRTQERRGLAASPEAVAVAYGKQAARQKRGGSGSHYATALDPVVPNPLGEKDMGDTPLTAPWLTEAQHKGRNTRFREEFKAARRDYSKQDLRLAAAKRKHLDSRKVLEDGNSKWKWTERLCLLVAPSLVKSELPKAGTGSEADITVPSKYETHKFGPRDEVMDRLSEALYAIAPISSLSRPRFIMAAQKAFDFNVNNTEGASNPQHLALVQGLVDSWGEWEGTKDHIDSRDLLSAMNMCMFPYDDIRNHLIFAFGAYASGGPLQRDQVTGEWYDLHKLTRNDVQRIIVNAAGTTGTRSVLRNMVEEAWRRHPRLCGESGRRISMAEFQLMLEDLPFGAVLLTRPTNPDRVDVEETNAITSFGHTVSDANPERYLSSIERMFSPFLVRLLARERKKIHIHVKLMAFVLRWRMLVAAQIFERWWEFTDTRMRARALMTEALDRWTTLTYRSGFNQLRNNVVRVSCASEIARVYRGHYARSYVRWMRDAEASALFIQSMWRGRSRFLWFMRKMRRRDFGARTMQRYWRGHRGRQVATRVLLEFYRVKKRQIDQEKRRWRAEIRTRAATRIESVVRGYLGRSIANQIRFDKEENERIQLEMAEFETEQFKQQKLYEQKMVKAFKEKLLDEFEAKEASKKSKAWKKQIFMNQYLRRLRAKLQKDRELHADEMAENDAFWGAYDDEWDIKMEAARKKTRNRVGFELGPNLGKDPEENAKLKATKLEVRNLAKKLRKESISNGGFMTQSQAKQDAKEQVVLERIELALADVKKKKQKKKDEIQAERDEEYDRTHSGERAAINDAKLTLVKKLQSIWIVYKARKLQRKLLTGLYVKEFDREAMEFYYYNTRTFASKWEKPLLLSKDVPRPDKWYKCRDPNSVMFYYWPGPAKGWKGLGEVTYEKPFDYYSDNEENPEDEANDEEGGKNKGGEYDWGEEDWEEEETTTE